MNTKISRLTPDDITLAQASEILGISRQRVHDFTKGKKPRLKTTMVLGHLILSRKEVEAFGKMERKSGPRKGKRAKK